MKTIGELLDEARKTTGATSDNQLAQQLKVTRGAVSNWRRGVALPDAVTCATLAGLTGEPLGRVLGIVGEARAISREEKAVWRKLAATAALLFLVALPWANPAVAHATVGHEQRSELCIMRSLVAFIRRMFRLRRGHGSPALLA